MPLRVGQRLWFVPNDRRSGAPYEVTVEKIGRKWALIGYRRRIDVETLKVDGGNYTSPGQCYEDRAAYETEVALQSAWSDFQQKVRSAWSVPEGVTMDEIRAAYAALFQSVQ